MAPRLTAAEVARLDPYQLMAALGKRVVHPGGVASTDELFVRADLRPGSRVLDIGCGPGTTAVRLARDHGAQVTAVDFDPRMVARAKAAVEQAGLEDAVAVQLADAHSLPFPEGAFDRVLLEAVVMFTDRERVVAEALRVTAPGGVVLDHEFIWATPPPDAARSRFTGTVCPGIRFDSVDDWVSLYEAAGLQDVETTTGPFVMMTPRGFLSDEGLLNTLAIMTRGASRWAYMKKMVWLMRNIAPAVPHLGHVVLSGRKAVRRPAAQEAPGGTPHRPPASHGAVEPTLHNAPGLRTRR